MLIDIIYNFFFFEWPEKISTFTLEIIKALDTLKSNLFTLNYRTLLEPNLLIPQQFIHDQQKLIFETLKRKVSNIFFEKKTSEGNFRSHFKLFHLNS